MVSLYIIDLPWEMYLGRTEHESIPHRGRQLPATVPDARFSRSCSGVGVLQRQFSSSRELEPHRMSLSSTQSSAAADRETIFSINGRSDGCSHRVDISDGQQGYVWALEWAHRACRLASHETVAPPSLLQTHSPLQPAQWGGEGYRSRAIATWDDLSLVVMAFLLSLSQ